MNIAFRRTNRLVRLCLMLTGLIWMSNSSSSTVTRFAQPKEASENKQVKILANGVELVELTSSAPKCGNQKGETIRLKVTNENPVDVRLYVHTGWKQWLPKDFPNQKRGDEITDYRCGPRTDYKVYAHAPGSSEP